MNAVDCMTWWKFEQFVAALLRAAGYQTRLTETYDYGADVIAQANGERLLVQIKHSTGPDIGNKAVQQVVAAMAYYQGTRGMVVTNRSFTSSAINLAKANRVELWDRDRLAKEMLAAHGPLTPSPVKLVPHPEFLQATPPESVPAMPAPSCPLCGARMLRRASAYGEFWACAGYPDCRGMRPA
jgi:restriction system protein